MNAPYVKHVVSVLWRHRERWVCRLDTLHKLHARCRMQTKCWRSVGTVGSRVTVVLVRMRLGMVDRNI